MKRNRNNPWRGVFLISWSKEGLARIADQRFTCEQHGHGFARIRCSESSFTAITGLASAFRCKPFLVLNSILCYHEVENFD